MIKAKIKARDIRILRVKKIKIIKHLIHTSEK